MESKKGFTYYVVPVVMFLLVLAGLGGIVLGVTALLGKDCTLLIFGTLGVCVLIFGGVALLGWLRDSYESGFGVGFLKTLLFIVILFGAPVAAFFLYLALWGIIPAFIAAGASFLISLIMVITMMSDGEFDGGDLLIGLSEIIGDIW